MEVGANDDLAVREGTSQRVSYAGLNDGENGFNVNRAEADVLDTRAEAFVPARLPFRHVSDGSYGAQIDGEGRLAHSRVMASEGVLEGITSRVVGLRHVPCCAGDRGQHDEERQVREVFVKISTAVDFRSYSVGPLLERHALHDGVVQHHGTSDDSRNSRQPGFSNLFQEAEKAILVRSVAVSYQKPTTECLCLFDEHRCLGMRAGFARNKHNVLRASTDDPFGDRATNTAQTARYQVRGIVTVQ